MIDVPKLLERLNIKAERRGREWIARCPNPKHEDKNPSWRIRDDGGPKHACHKCWPCGLGGGPIALVSTVLGVPPAQAREWLGEDGNAEEPIPATVQVAVPSVHEFRLPAGVHLDPFERWPDPPRQYAASRGIDAAQVERWGIGWASVGKLAGRIVFPVRDDRGRLRGYTARTYADQEKRYREPDKEEGANRDVLLGEQHWPTMAKRKAHRVYVTEGAINGLALEHALADLGPYFGALCGSSLSAMASIKLASFGEVIVLRDPDGAGRRVATEVATSIGRHRPVFFVDFPAGKDAASVSREELRALVFTCLRGVS